MEQHSGKLAFLFGLGAAVVGCTIAGGYVLEIPALLRPWAKLPSPVFGAALCLLAGGAALMLAARPPRRWASRSISVLGGIVATLGGLASAERASGINLGVYFDRLRRAVGTQDVTPERLAPIACLCFVMLGAGLATLPFVRGRRAHAALTVIATGCAAVGAITTAGYLLHIEFMLTWPSSTPVPPQIAFGLLLLGLGTCSALLSRAKGDQGQGVVYPERAIQLTAIWTLSLIAFAAGIATFALAQYEYQDLVRADLVRTSQERRGFLDYAIREHLDHLGIAVQPFAAAAATGDRRAATAELQDMADRLVQSGYSGWRLETASGVLAAAGTFIDHPELSLDLAGRYRAELLLKDGYFLRAHVPVRASGRVVGLVVAEEPFPELTRMKREADAWNETGEMALCAMAGDQMNCFPLRSNPRVALYPRDVNGRPLPMSLALDHQQGIAETLDYRQRRVFAAYGPVGFTGLGMVIKIDAAELNQPLGRRFGSVVLLLLALVAAGAWLLRRRLQPLTRALVEAHEEARRVGAQFEAAAQSSLDACFIMAAVRDARDQVVDFRIRFLNPSGEVMVRRASEEVIGRTLREILPQAHSEYFVGRYRRIVTTGQSLNEEFRSEDEDGGARWIAHQAVKLGDGVSITARDITRIKAVERQLRDRAENDVLTGLPNRTIFFERLGEALGEARKAQTGVAVLFLDIDRFKQVNDTHGHPVGDAVLREFATRLRSVVRSSDTIARLGGDEFAMILPGLCEIDQAERVAKDILGAVGVTFSVDDRRLEIGTSIGIAYSHAGNETPELLVGRADRKLYQAKSEGRGRYSGVAEKRAA